MPRHYSGKRQRDLKHVEPHASGYISLLYWIGTITTGCILIFCGKQHCFNDAMAHWARILQIRAGNIIPVFSDEYHDWVVYRDHGKIITFNNTAVNAPFVYFPSLIVRGNFRVSSVATLICSATIIAVAIWVAKSYVNIILAIAILPTTFFSMIFPTADAVTNSYCLLFIAVVLCLYQRDDMLQYWHIALLCMMGALLGQVKITCFIIALFVLFLIPKAHGCVKKITLALPALTAFVSMWLWRAKTSQIAVAPNRVPLEKTHELEGQLLQSPWKIFLLIGRSLFKPMDFDTEKINGQLVNSRRNLQFFTGTEEIQLPLIVMAPVLIAIMMLLIVHMSYKNINKLQVGLIVLIIVLYYVLSCVAMSITWVGNVDVYASGLQNRYFIPVLPLAALLFPNFIRDENINRRVLAISVAALTAFSYIAIAITYVIQWNDSWKKAEVSPDSSKNHTESYGGCYLLGIPMRGVVPVAAFADDKCTVAIDTLLALFALLAESTTDVFSSGISRIVIA